MMDERNDVYTAKGGGMMLQVPPLTAGTKSQSSLRGGGGREDTTQLRQQAVSANAQSNVNSYNFKMPAPNVSSGSKRLPSTISDKSHTSSMKSNYSGNVAAAATGNQTNPYQRVMTSFSSATKKKVKTLAAPESSGGNNNFGSKLYEKIKTGMQAALGGGSG